MKVQFTDPLARLSRAHATDAGLDMNTVESALINPLASKLVDSGVRVAIPEGHFGLLLGRSSLATKRNAAIIPGVIDVGYRGNIKMNVRNLGEYHRVVLEPGDSIGQLLVLPLASVDIEVVEELSEATDRGTGGFGSTD